MDSETFEAVLKLLKPRFERVLPEHVSEDPFRVLIGCILSTRTRDEKTDRAYQALFEAYPDPASLAGADSSDVERLIRPVNFYKTKAKRIIAAARFLVQEFGGGVPSDRARLLLFPGIGPKCADIVLSFGFGVDTVAVDTHVETVAKRLGLAAEDAGYDEVKASIEGVCPKEELRGINDLFVSFGRAVCLRQAPKCHICPVYRFCVWPGKVKRMRLKVKAGRRRRSRPVRRG